MEAFTTVEEVEHEVMEMATASVAGRVSVAARMRLHTRVYNFLRPKARSDLVYRLVYRTLLLGIARRTLTLNTFDRKLYLLQAKTVRILLHNMFHPLESPYVLLRKRIVAVRKMRAVQRRLYEQAFRERRECEDETLMRLMGLPFDIFNLIMGHLAPQ